MAKKSTGLSGLVKDVLISSLTGKPMKKKKKTTKPKKSTSKIMSNSAIPPSARAGAPSSEFKPYLGGNIFSKNTAEYRAKLNSIVSKISLGNKWGAIGKGVSDDLNKQNMKIVDVSDQSDEIQQNLETIKNQFAIIANFMVKTDYRFRDFENNVRQSIVAVSTETAKNQISLVNHLHVKLNSFDATLDKFSSKLETHDRQLDEIYAEIKQKKKDQDGKSFLERKREDFFQRYKGIDNNQNQQRDSSSFLEKGQKILGIFGSYAELGETAASITAGYAATKMAGKMAGRGLAKGAGALTKGMAKGGFVVGSKVGGKIAGRTGMKIGGKLMAKAVPGLGWVLLGYDTLQAGKKYYETGSAKEAGKAFIGLGSDEEITSATDLGEKKDVKNIDITSIEDINITSKKNIKIESKQELTLKASKIILDAASIEFRTKNIGQGTYTGSSGDSSATGSNSTTLNNGGRTPGGMGSAAPANKNALSNWFNNLSKGSSVAPGSPYVGRGGSATPNFSGGGGRTGGAGSGGYVGSSGGPSQSVRSSSPTETLKPIAPKPESALTAIGPGSNIKSVDIDKKGKVNLPQYKGLLLSEIKKQGLDKLSPADAKRYGIDGSAESWSNFMMGLTEVESGFKPSDVGDIGQFGGHGSRGMFQLSPDDATNYKLQKKPFSYDQLRDPVQNTKAAVSIAKNLISKHGSISRGMGRYWGPIQRGNSIPYGKYADVKAIGGNDNMLLPGMKNMYNIADKNATLLKRSRQARIDANWMKNPPKMEDFANIGDFNKAQDLYNAKKSGANVSSGITSASKDQRASIVGNAKARGIQNVDPRLVEITQEASKYLPEGYRAEIYSGYRPGDPRQHGRGNALDMRIIGPDGKVLANYQNKTAFREYEKFAQAVKKIQTDKYPKMGLRWGGYFSGSKGKYGALDLMHFDTAEHIGMAGGSFEKGLTPQQARAWGIKDSMGMGNISQFSLPTPGDVRTGNVSDNPEVRASAKLGIAAYSRSLGGKSIGESLAFTAEDGLPKGWKEASTVGINPMNPGSENYIKQIKDAGKGLHMYFGGPGDPDYKDPNTGYDFKKYTKDMSKYGGWDKFMQAQLLKNKPKSFEIDTLDAQKDKGMSVLNQQIQFLKDNKLDSKIMLKNVSPETLNTIMSDKNLRPYIGGAIHEATSPAMQAKAAALAEAAKAHNINVIKTGDTHKYQTDAPTPVALNQGPKKPVLAGLQKGEALKQRVESAKTKVAEVKARPKQNIAQNGAISGGQKVKQEKVSTEKSVAEKKPQQSTKTAEAKDSGGDKDYNKNSGSSEPTRSASGGNAEANSTNDNGSDSIPPGPSDDGYGDYKLCLI